MVWLEEKSSNFKRKWVWKINGVNKSREDNVQEWGEKVKRRKKSKEKKKLGGKE